MSLDDLLGEAGFAGLGSKSADQIEELGRSVRECPPPEVRIYLIRTDCSVSDLNQIWNPKGCSIYVFEIFNAELIDVVRASYKIAVSEKARKISRDNYTRSNCLYVGSTTRSSLLNRLRQHFGFGHRDTYALQLSHWRGPPFDVRLTVANYRTAQPRVIQELEDFLWSRMRPMFGKTGRS
jgi:hypothetical protein